MLASSSRGRRSACSSCGLLIEQPANATPSSSLLDRWSTAACRAVHALQSCARLARGHFQRTAALQRLEVQRKGGKRVRARGLDLSMGRATWPA